MTPIEIATLEHASRSAFAWVPEGYDGQRHFRSLLTAFIPAAGIVAASALLLLVL